MGRRREDIVSLFVASAVCARSCLVVELPNCNLWGGKQGTHDVFIIFEGRTRRESADCNSREHLGRGLG